MPEKQCNQCSGKEIKPEPVMIPYIVLEDAQVRSERKDKRNLILILVLIFALLFSNMAWLWIFNQYDYSSYTVEQDATDGGNVNYIGQNGEINNGVSESSGEDTYKKTW